LAPELVNAFGAVVHPIIGIKHFVLVLVASSLMLNHYRLNSAQKTKEYLIGEILILKEFLFIPLPMFLIAVLIVIREEAHLSQNIILF
jgi:putative copper export protein